MDDLLSWAIENYHVGLMTNIMPGFLNELIDHNLVPNINYDVIIDSSEVGAIKPEEAIYEEAEDRSNCQPSEILLIDDSRPNLMTASKKAGKCFGLIAITQSKAFHASKTPSNLKTRAQIKIPQSSINRLFSELT